jgi:trigger factor
LVTDTDMSEVVSAVEDRGPVQKAIKVTVPGDQVREAFDSAYKRVARTAQVPGFRKGKVPRKVLEEHYGGSVREDVVRELIQSGCSAAVRSEELDVVSDPELLSQNLTESGEVVFEALVEVRPQFELGTYSGVDAERKIVRVTQDHIEATLANMRERMAVLQTEEERVNVAHGDVIVFDMYGFVDGAPLEQATGEGVQLEVGSGRFPEEFETGVVGVTRAIRTPIEVPFAQDHGDPELAGKTVRFEVTVKEIKNKILPDLEDAFASEVYEECETLDDLRTKIRESLEERSSAEADQRLRGELLERLVDSHDFDVPPSIVERQMANSLHEMGIHDVPEERLEEIRGALEPAAIKRVRASFILDAVAKAEELKVEQEELQEEVKRQLVAAGADAERVRNHYAQASSVAVLHGRMLRDKAMDRMLELASRRDVEVDESDVAANTVPR